MAKLTHLFLDHMSLQELSNTAVSKCPSLVHLDISYNQLRVVQPFSEGSPKLARLNLAGNPIFCNCYLQPFRYRRPKTAFLSMLQEKFSPHLLISMLRRSREWSIRHKVKLMGTCGGPPHMLGETLAAVYPPQLLCQSQEVMLKAELEEASRMAPAPTEKPENQMKCPVNCVCEVGRYSYHKTGFLVFSISLIFRQRRNTLRVRIEATPKFLEASLLTRVCSTCAATTSTTSLATASPESRRSCHSICSVARSWRWRMGLSVE